MLVATTRAFGPYHADDVADQENLAEFNNRNEEYLLSDPYVDSVVFKGVEPATHGDCDTWNLDMGGDPVHSPEYTVMLVYQVKEEV